MRNESRDGYSKDSLFSELRFGVPFLHRQSKTGRGSSEVNSAVQSRIAEAGGRSNFYRLGELGSEDASAIGDLANRILTADADLLVLMTAAGARYFLEAACKLVPRQRLIDCVSDTQTVAGSRGAAESLKSFGVEPSIVIERGASSRSNELSGSQHWRDVLIAIDRKSSIFNQSVILERSAEIFSLRAGLESRGASVTEMMPFSSVVEAPESQESDSRVAAQLADDLRERRNDALLFLDADSTWQLIEQLKTIVPSAGPQSLIRLLDCHLVFAVGHDAASLLEDHGIGVDLTVPWREEFDNRDFDLAIEQIGVQLESIQNQRRMIRMTLSGPATSAVDPQAPWYNNPFMKACRGEPTDVTPIWMMRQAGRYMAEYRAVRDKISFLDLCANPQLCSEVMCTAVKRLGVDAAIIFSDLLPILVPMGCDLEFAKGDGPVIHNPVRTHADIDRIKPLESLDSLQFVIDTVKHTRNDLPADMPLIGFSGSPFTLASYMIEGGSSRNYIHTKKLMFSDRGAWDQLMEHLTRSISLYVRGQVDAGAQCIQLFDSWAGCLSFEDYRNFVHPYVKQIIASIPASVPVINFATGNPSLLPLLADTQASVIGIDWRTRLDDAWQTVGFDRAVQGNLDPTVLLTDPVEIRRQAKVVLDQAAGRPGHIFNLGHGILPMTPVDNAIALVDAVHELSQR